MELDDLIYVAGHKGLVGSAIVRDLKRKGFENLLVRTHVELDLTSQEDTRLFFKKHRPDYVFIAAAKVGGIVANRDAPAQFIYENLMIQNNLIHQSYKAGVKKLLFLGSSCIYPKFAKQPISEDALLTGKLEPTNEAYAIAKIAGLSMCDSYRKQYNADFISAMPTSLYGFNDNFDLVTSHVLPALLRKIHEAKERGDGSFVIWGTGTPLREFLYVDDLADGLTFLMTHYSSEGHINVGSGEETSIANLAEIIKDVVRYEGTIAFDTTKPDGTPRKLMDSSKIRSLGWKPKTTLREGISKTYDWYLEHESNIIRS
jgi:GDP-L-fucose synthase